MLKKALLGAVAVAAIGAGVIAVRTARFAPGGVADANDIKLADIPAIDLAGAASRLGASVRILTVSHQDKAENKAEEWTKLHTWLQTTYPKAHAAMSREVIGGGTLMYRWDGSDPALPALIMMAHQDVVPVTPGTEKDWKHPPFDGVIADGAVWGRGSFDDKGSLVGLFEAFEALANAGFKPKRTIYIVSGHDEEVGGNGAKEAAKLLESRGVKALMTVDEGSAVITNAPVINKSAIMIGVAEKGYATLKIVANAPGGHSSMPPKEIGSVNVAKAIVAINEKQFASEIRPPVSAMLETLAAEKGGSTKMAVANQWLFGGKVRDQIGATPSGAAMMHTTIAPTMLTGSPKENVLPQTATALINYRIAPWQTSKDVMARAKEAVGKLPVELSWIDPPREPSPVSSSTSQGWKLLRAAAESEAPGAAVAPFLVVGATDSRNFTGLSQDVYRFAPAHLSTKDTAMIHGTNEHMSVENLGRMIRFYARLIATAAG